MLWRVGVAMRDEEMTSLKREHAAWLALMASFVLAAAAGILFRDDILRFMHGHSREALMQRARSLAEQGDEAADAVYGTLVRRYPEHEEVLLAYAEHLDEQGRDAEAEALYRRAAATGRQRFSAVRRYVAFLERTGRYDEALEVYEDYVARHPEDPAARLDLGIRLLNRNKLERAETHLHAATQNEALRAEARTRLASVHARRGEWEKAIALWSAVASSDDTLEHTLLWQDVAAAYEVLDVWNGAAVAWETYGTYFPNSLMAARRLRTAYERVGDHAGRERMDLRIKALSPPLPIEQGISGRVYIEGVSALDGLPAPGTTVTGDVYVRFQGNVGSTGAPVVQFWLLSRYGGFEQALDCEPSVLGMAPFWRGDSRRQRFTMRLPDALTAGRYTVALGIEAEPGRRVELWWFDIPADAGGSRP